MDKNKTGKKTMERLSEKRLSFLYAFLSANYISHRSIPREVIPYPTINTNLQKDDFKLSQVMRIINHYGHRLLIYLEPKDPYLAMRYREKCVYTNAARVNLSSSIKLAFLKDFIEINNYKFKEITKLIGLKSASNSYYWFNQDDISICKIYKIAYHFNVNVRFLIEPIGDEGSPDPEREGSKSIIDMRSLRHFDINESMTKTVFEK